MDIESKSPIFARLTVLSAVAVGLLLALAAAAGYFLVATLLAPATNFAIQKPEVVKMRLTNFPSITPEGRQAVQAGFDRDWKAANTESKKYDAYRTLYGSLWAAYNVSRDPAIRLEMKKIQEFLASRPEWQRDYQADLEDKNAFLP